MTRATMDEYVQTPNIYSLVKNKQRFTLGDLESQLLAIYFLPLTIKNVVSLE